jgi:hypothetical protein
VSQGSAAEMSYRELDAGYISLTTSSSLNTSKTANPYGSDEEHG